MVNIRRRALFNPAVTGGLPAGYRQVAWINGNGKTKIVLQDWGIIRPFDIEIGLNLVANLNFINYIFTGEQGAVGWCNNRKAYAGTGYGNPIFDLNTDYVITAYFREEDSSCLYLVGGNDAGAKPIKDPAAIYSTIPTIFGRYSDASYRSSFKLYYFKVYDIDGNIIHNCIPCIDDNNNPCLYDMITERTAYFSNSTDDDASLATYGELMN